MDSQFLSLISSSFGSFAISESLGRIMICLRQRNNFQTPCIVAIHSLFLSHALSYSLSLSLTHKLSFTHGSPHTTEAQTLFFHRSFFSLSHFQPSILSLQVFLCYRVTNSSYSFISFSFDCSFRKSFFPPSIDLCLDQNEAAEVK